MSRDLPTVRVALVLFSLLATYGCTSSSITAGPSLPKCGVSLNLSSTAIGAAGGVATINVSTQRECTWSVSADSPWISSMLPESGQGSGEVRVQVSANPQPSARQGTVSINTQRVQLRQDAAVCQFDVSPLAHLVAAAGGEGTVAVAPSTSPCAWTATSSVAWITIADGGSGTAASPVSFVVAANTGPERTGTLTVAGKAVTVRQAAVAPSGACTYALGSTSQAVSEAGANNLSVSVTTSGSCAWTAATSASWIHVTAGASGSGNGTVALTVDANTGASRAAPVTIAGQTFTVTQAAKPNVVPCTYALNPETLSVGAAAGPGTLIAITAPAGCAWAATTQTGWITLTGQNTSGTGNGAVGFTVAANTGAERTGTIAIAGKTFTVTQAAAPPPCSFAIAPPSQSVPAAGGPATAVAVTAASGCNWTAVSNDTWLTINAGASGSGDGTVTFTAAANTGASRTGTLTIAGKTHTVTQGAPAPACTYAINPAQRSFSDTGGTGSITVTAAAGCAWTAVSRESWATVTAGASGSGNGTVSYAVSRNTSSHSRTAIIVVAGKNFTIEQDED